MSDKNPWRNEDLLREKYVDEGMDTYKLAEEWGCSDETVRRWIHKFGIKTRSVNDYNDDSWKDESWLREKYLNEDLDSFEISEIVGVHRSTVSKQLRESGIRKEKLEQERPWQNEETLRKMYLEKEMHTTEISDHFGCSNVSIGYWLQKYDIPRRHKLPCVHINQSGYQYVNHSVDNQIHSVPIHRLVAIAHGLLDPSELKNSKLHIHHKNTIPWDNRPSNLQVLTASEHMSLHNSKNFEPTDG